MLDQVTRALEQQDYRTAARLLKQLAKQEPKNPWVRLYVGRLYEATEKPEAAETAYRYLLRHVTNPKIVSQARQGLERLAATQQAQRQQALANAMSNPDSSEPGVLILEPIDPQKKQTAAQALAQILQLDPYTARLQLPTRGWRLYRTGAVGELRFYGSSLRQAGIPCFWATLTEIQSIHVFNVRYFSESKDGGTNPSATVVCQNPQGQLGALSFTREEVAQRVEGRLPLFEEVVDRDARGKLQRKTQTLDYVQVCDLHLPGRKSILRLSDRTYQFQQGIALNSMRSQPQGTAHSHWHALRDFINQFLPETPLWSDFTPFAETAIDYQEVLGRLPPHIDLFRRQATLWDAALQLYSTLVFLRQPGA